MSGRRQWRDDGARVIPAGSLDANTAQTSGMNRAAAINFARVGAQKLQAGTVTIHPHAKTGAPHPHGSGRSSGGVAACLPGGSACYGVVATHHGIAQVD